MSGGIDAAESQVAAEADSAPPADTIGTSHSVEVSDEAVARVPDIKDQVPPVEGVVEPRAVATGPGVGTDAGLTRSQLCRRQDAYLVNHYVGLHVTIVSVALGIAGIAAASLLTADGVPLRYHVLFGLLWAAALLATAVAYAGALAGSFALPGQPPSIWDLVVPLFIAVAEFLLFAVLTLQLTGLESPATVVTVWFFCMGAFGLLAAVAVARARHLFQTTRYAADIAPTVDWYVRQLRSDIGGASTTAVLGFAGGALQMLWPDSPLLAFGFAGMILVLLVGALFIHGRTASTWRRALAPTG